MSKLQKIFFGVFILASCLLAYLGYRSLKNSKQPSVKAFTLIPDSCSVLLTFENYTEFSNSLRNKSLIWQDLRLISNLKPFDRYLTYFDSLLANDNELAELTANNPVYFATYSDSQFLIALNLKELSDEKMFRGKSSALLKNSPFKLNAELHDGVLAVSNNPSLLQKLFNRAVTKLADNKTFMALKETANYQGTSVYINKEGLPLNKSFSGITIKPESIALNGISLPDSSTFNGDISAPPINSYDFLKNIPILSNAFEVYSVGNAEKLFSSHSKKNWWDPVNETALFNAKKQFYQNLDQYLASISLPSKHKALLLHIKDSAKLSEIIPFIKDTASKGQTVVELINNESFSRSTFPNIHLPDLKYMVLFEDRLVLTETKEDAEVFVNANRNNSSVLQNSDFQNYASKNLNLEFHALKYAAINSLSRDQLPFGNWLKENELPDLKNIAHYSFLSVFKNGHINSRFHVKYFQENILDEPNVLWTMNADSLIITKPYLFKNHVTAGNEITFQTQNNDLYLLNATGKIVWKKHLTENIRSDIYTVDAFKNGKFQLLFNSDNYIHLLDRNGNYVQGYPVKLPSKATNKLCVFDYENKNDLRLFIACSDHKIYNYTIWGIKNDGYKPLITADDVILPIRYCKVGLSDYLLTADRKGKIYAFSRKGEGRIDFKNKLVENATDFDLEEGTSLSNTELIYYDEKNNLANKISLTDKKEIFKTNTGETKWSYVFSDFDKNKIKDIILARSESLEVFDVTGNKIFNVANTGVKLPCRLSHINLENTAYVSLLDTVNSNVSIISEQQLVKEFSGTKLPLACALFNDGKPYLLVVSGKQIKCYKL